MVGLPDQSSCEQYIVRYLFNHHLSNFIFIASWPAIEKYVMPTLLLNNESTEMYGSTRTITHDDKLSYPKYTQVYWYMTAEELTPTDRTTLTPHPCAEKTRGPSTGNPPKSYRTIAQRSRLCTTTSLFVLG